MRPSETFLSFSDPFIPGLWQNWGDRGLHNTSFKLCTPYLLPVLPSPLLRLVSVLSGSCPVSKQWQGQGWSPRVRHCHLPHSLRAAFMADGKDLDEPIEHWRRKIPRWGYRWHGIDTWNSRCESVVLMTWLMQGGEVVTGTFCYGCYLPRELMKPFRQIVSMFYRGRL